MSTGRFLRVLNIAFGSWLIVTVFLWSHSTVQAWSTAVTGAAVVLAATAALTGAPRTRYVSITAGVWLVASIWVLAPASMTTVLNNAVVGTLVFLLGLVPVAENGRVASLREGTP